MWSIAKKILYNIGFIYLLTQLGSVFNIKSNNDLIVFYTWILILFNIILFFLNNKFKKIIMLILLSLFPFLLSGVLTDLTGKEVLNFYNYYYTNGYLIFHPYWIHIFVSTLIVIFVGFGKNKCNKINNVEIVNL